MWLYTIVKKYLEEKPDNNEFKPKFKCPMKHGWISGNNTMGTMVTEYNFIPSLWNYIIKKGSNPPHKSTDKYWMELSTQLKICVTNKVYLKYIRAPETILFLLMCKYKITNIKLYPDSTILDFKENAIDSIPENILNEIKELSKFNSFFNCDMISIDCDYNGSISIQFLLNPYKFILKSNYFLTNNQSFTNMINAFPNYELYVKLIKIYSNPKEYIKSILIPLIIGNKLNDNNIESIVLNIEFLKEFISTSDSNKLKSLKFYITIYNMAFDDNEYKTFFENNILSLLSEY